MFNVLAYGNIANGFMALLLGSVKNIKRQIGVRLLRFLVAQKNQIKLFGVELCITFAIFFITIRK